MSDADDFAPPAFKPEAAMQQLQRSLRELRPLVERGSCYALQGHRVLELERDDKALVVRIAKRPAHAPEWETRICRSSADVRKLLDTIKLRLARWTDE